MMFPCSKHSTFYIRMWNVECEQNGITKRFQNRHCTGAEGVMWNVSYSGDVPVVSRSPVKVVVPVVCDVIRRCWQGQGTGVLSAGREMLGEMPLGAVRPP